MRKLIRTIHPEIKILDEKKGLVEYVASDESIDSHREVIRVNGWRFDRFEKNAPFVDSHDYYSLDKLLGQVVEAKIENGKLVETVQWAVDVQENTLAQLGWKMTVGGFLKAVSVGFMPTKYLYRTEAGFREEIESMGLSDRFDEIRAVYLEQQQIELSAVVIGSNPNALMKAYKAECLNDSDVEQLSKFFPASSALEGDEAEAAKRHQTRETFLKRLEFIKQL